MTETWLKSPYLEQFYPPKPWWIGETYISQQRNNCEHCFCIEEYVFGKLHIKCCMCGTRKLKI